MWVQIRKDKTALIDTMAAVPIETRDGTKWHLVATGRRGMAHFSGYMDEETALRNLARFNNLVDAMEVDYGEEA